MTLVKPKPWKTSPLVSLRWNHPKHGDAAVQKAWAGAVAGRP